MFVNKTHGPFALRGTYIFPYVIGTVNKERLWRPTDSAPLNGELPKDHPASQLFAVNYRLGFLGSMIKSRSNISVETIIVAYDSCINLNVQLVDSNKSVFTTREEWIKSRWEEFESTINYTFGLVVR